MTSLQNHSYHHATTIGNFDPFVASPLPPRPEAWCERCGCRLSAYRPPVTNHCWACEQMMLAATPPSELHPPLRTLKPSQHHPCPKCGTLCHIRANQCITCRRRGEP
jgi:hypothetical protein